jgi:AcrR family transcriptional regulator
MTGSSRAGRAPRNSLSRARVVEAALEIADSDGLNALTIRAVATRLETKPMSLYRHVANKDELLDALIERLYAEFEMPDPQHPDWRAQLRRRARSVRQVLVRHPWSIAVIETRSGPNRPFTFAHAEAVLATLITAGCSPRRASRAFVVLDSYVYGFALQEITMPSTDPAAGVSDDTAAAMQQYPRLTAVAASVMADADYNFGAEFEAGLDLVLDGINRWRDTGTAT